MFSVLFSLAHNVIKSRQLTGRVEVRIRSGRPGKDQRDLMEKQVRSAEHLRPSPASSAQIHASEVKEHPDKRHAANRKHLSSCEVGGWIHQAFGLCYSQWEHVTGERKF